MSQVKPINNGLNQSNSTAELTANTDDRRESLEMEKNSSSSEPQPRSLLKIVVQLVVSAILGFIFGVALEKTRVFEPKSIRMQMVFEKWIMLKMFLAAMASCHLSLSILSLLPWTKLKFETASKEYVACFGGKGILTSCIGPFVLGVGMTLSGACPGMVLAQVGAWAPNAIFTLLGALVGALLYGMLAKHIDSVTNSFNPFREQQVHKQFDKPFALFALPLALVVGIVVFLLEFFIPYQDDLEQPGELSYNIVKTIAWPPYVGGILVGLLQIPMVIVLEDTIGGSSSYVTVMSQWVVTRRLQKMFPYLANKRCGVGNWWQVLYVSGAILGALAAAALSHSLAEVQGVGILEGLFGGVLMLVGARFAAGCTSGHGISGMGMLAWLSFLAVPFMFGGAISTAFIMKAADHSLYRFVNSTLDL